MKKSDFIEVFFIVLGFICASAINWILWRLNILPMDVVWRFFAVAILTSLIVWQFWEFGIATAVRSYSRHKSQKSRLGKSKQLNKRRGNSKGGENIVSTNNFSGEQQQRQEHTSPRKRAKEAIEKYRDRSKQEPQSNQACISPNWASPKYVTNENTTATQTDADRERIDTQVDVSPPIDLTVLSVREKPTRFQSLPLESICQAYNAGVVDQSERQSFRERYKPIRVGTANAMQRRRDINIAPEFQTANDGDYYAVQVEGTESGNHAVVPRFDLTFQESSFGPGAMGMVFVCEGYAPQLRYRRVKVRRPALFKRDNDRWIFDEKGELDLGQGEP